MLEGRLAAPVPDAASARSSPVVAPGIRRGRVVETVPGVLDPQGFAANLVGRGWAPTWARTSAHEADKASLRGLARAALEVPPSGAGRPVVVVEAPDPVSAQTVLDEARTSARPSVAVVTRFGVGAEQGGRFPADMSPLTYLDRFRPALARSVRRSQRLLGGVLVLDALLGADGVADLTGRLAQATLARRPAPDGGMLSLAAQLGYLHESLGCLGTVLGGAAEDPWWIPLESGWFQIAAEWRTAVIAAAPPPPAAAVARLAGALLDVGAPEECVELCLDAGCPGIASDVLSDLAPRLEATGRHEVLDRWAGRLPPDLRGRLGGRSPAARAPDDLGTVREPALRRRRSRRAHLVLSVRLLGDIDVRLGGRRVQRWHGRLGRTALAFLVLQGERHVPANSMAAALWPDAPEDVARNRLHVTMHRLRGDLAEADPRPVIVHEDGYALDPTVMMELDTRTFDEYARRGDEAARAGRFGEAVDAYVAAAETYRGDLLAGERDDDWAVLSREHYHVRLLDVLGYAADAALAADRPALAIELGRRLLALDPCREDLHCALMRAYLRLGQPHLAVRQYEECVLQLETELGLAPSRTTVELRDRILAQVLV